MAGKLPCNELHGQHGDLPRLNAHLSVPCSLGDEIDGCLVSVVSVLPVLVCRRVGERRIAEGEDVVATLLESGLLTGFSDGSVEIALARLRNPFWGGPSFATRCGLHE